MGRLRGHAHQSSRHRAGGLPIGYGALATVYLGVAVAVLWILRRLAETPLEPATPAAPTRIAEA